MTETRFTAGRPSRSIEPAGTWDGLDDPTASRAEGPSLQELVWSWASELRRRWLSALLAFGVGLSPMVSLALLSIPSYTATGVVQVSSSSPLAVHPLLELTGSGAGPNVETEIELMRRREFVLGVFKDLRLNLVDPRQPDGLTLDLSIALGGASPVSPALVRAREALAVGEVAPHHGADIALRIVATDEATMTVEVGEDGAAGSHELRVGERLATAALTLEFSRLPVDVGAAIDLVLRRDGALFDELQGALTVTSVGGRSNPTNLVRVAFTAADRATAQAVVGRLMARYVEQSREWQTSSASQSVQFIASQLAEAAARLAEQEETLRAFAESERAVQLDAQAQATIETVAEIESERLRADLQTAQMDQVLGGMKGRLDRGKAHLTANFFDDPVLAASVAKLTEDEVRYEVLKATLTPEHPQLVALAAEIRMQQQEVARLLRSARLNLATRAGELDRQLKSTLAALEKYPAKQLQLTRLMRAVEVSERLYSFLLEKHNEAEILEASTASDKRVVDAANFPHLKAAPRRGRLLAMGVVAGLVLAFAAVYLARAMQRKLGGVAAITGAIGWPVYGTIPALSPAPTGESTVLGTIWRRGPNAAAEATRALAVCVSQAPVPGRRGRIVQITSSRSGEGKSTVSASLAVALARTGARVLLVDLDLRKSVQHRTWGIPRAPGFVELVTRQYDPDAARALIRRDPTHGVALLPAGTRAVDTTALLMTDALPAMLAGWAGEYDYVLIDSPPAFVPDTSVVARSVDLVLLIARPGVVERGELNHATGLLARLAVRKGLVLNGVEPQHLGFGHDHVEDYYTYGLEDRGEDVAGGA
jgi:capsular exopolysaccharide synthesis family protein